MKPSQLSLGLAIRDPFDVRYFVFHSGVAAAYEAATARIAAHLADDASPGVVLFVYGAAGVGKSHFLEVCRQYAKRADAHDIELIDDITPAMAADTEWCRQFVSTYQGVITRRGMLLLASRYCYQQLSFDESVRSRLASAQQFELKNPGEEELLPIVESIAERKNLQLSQRTLGYILRRVPRNPLSFENLFATIDELCTLSGESAGLKLVRSVLTNPEVELAATENEEALLEEELP